MKRIFNLILLIIILMNFVGCGDQHISKQKKENISNYLGLVTNTAGINDGSFNALAWKGLQKSSKNLGFKVEYLESKTENDFKTNIEYFTDCALDMLFCVGYEMSDEVREIAEMYPDEYYTMINYTFDDKLDNVLCIEFEDQQAAFEVGYLAAHNTNTGKVGFIGGIESGIMDAFEYGYRAGVNQAAKELNKKVDIDIAYINSFSDLEEAEKVADKMYSNEVDIIFHAVGGAGNGVIDAAKKYNKYVIGSDMDQHSLAPNNVISSTIRNIDVVVYDIATEIKNTGDVKKIVGKSKLLGMNENAVGIADTTKNMVSKELWDKLQLIEEQIKNEKIDPPYNKETYEDYMSNI